MHHILLQLVSICMTVGYFSLGNSFFSHSALFPIVFLIFICVFWKYNHEGEDSIYSFGPSTKLEFAA
jgi:hypothetical protein